MRFAPTAIEGLTIVEAQPHADERGLFARLYCPEEFEVAGLGDFQPTQVNLSRNDALHTLRGMHFQDPPFAEAKLVRVTRGRIWDVAIDLRRDSPTYKRWAAVELDATSMRGLYMPEGLAHGFITLEPDTDVLYQMGRMYEPGQARGVRFDDPAFGIDWPAAPAVIDAKDQGWPLWAD